MGKYSQWVKSDSEVTNQVTTNESLTRIANELAESNRLKRLELKIIRKQYTVHTKHGEDSWHSPSDKELEDQT